MLYLLSVNSYTTPLYNLLYFQTEVCCSFFSLFYSVSLLLYLFLFRFFCVIHLFLSYYLGVFESFSIVSFLFFPLSILYYRFCFFFFWFFCFICPSFLYYPFVKYVEYIFSPGGLSMMSYTILRLLLAALTKHDFILWPVHRAIFKYNVGLAPRLIS